MIRRREEAVQRTFNAGATGGATRGATPVQRPVDGGVQLSPIPPGVARPLGGARTPAAGAAIRDLARRVDRLRPDWSRPESFFEERSEIAADLARLAEEMTV